MDSHQELVSLLTNVETYLRLDKISDLAVLLVGIGLGIIGRNLFALIKGVMGFAGSFFGRMFVGWWQEVRRETPNVLDVVMVVPVTIEGRRVLLMDALIGPRKLSDIYLNPRVAFGVRIQTFSTRRDRPWIYFSEGSETPIGRRVRAWRNAKRRARGLPELTLRSIRKIRYRRVYQPVESLIGQYLTNEWATTAALGTDVCLFRFIIIIVYEKYEDDYIDRQFHALAIWDQVVAEFDADKLTIVQPEFSSRGETIRHIVSAYRELGADAAWQFGSIVVPVPRSILTGSYRPVLVPNAAGELIPVHRPAGSGINAHDAAVIAHAGAAAASSAAKPAAPAPG